MSYSRRSGRSTYGPNRGGASSGGGYISFSPTNLNTKQYSGPQQPDQQNGQSDAEKRLFQQQQQQHQQQQQLQNQQQLQQQQLLQLQLKKEAEDKKLQLQQNEKMRILQDLEEQEKLLADDDEMKSDVQGDADDGTGRPPWKKRDKAKGKMPMALRRKKLNTRLSKLLTPKSALMIVHEFKPGCTYMVTEALNSNPKMFLAHVEHEGRVLATGQGHSKQMAKNNAAENAIRIIVSELMSKREKEAKEAQEAQALAESQGVAAPPQEGDDDAAKMETEDEEGGVGVTELPWAGLASFAMYKLFSEWHNQGSDVPMGGSNKNAQMPPKASKAAKAANAVRKAASAQTKKELPENPLEKHPTLLVNSLMNGVQAVEISRTPPPDSVVTVGYEVDGKMYTGIGRNRKDARKEAAKSVLLAMYGLVYPN